MPIYEYECESCGRVEEIFQKISDRPLQKCGHCSGRLHKLISQSSFHLKGTGWYVTDYANKHRKKTEAKPAKTEGGGADASATAAESKKTSSTAKPSSE